MPTKGEVNRAGEFLRDMRNRDARIAWTSENVDRLFASISIVQEFRRGFAYPMQKVAVGLRQFVRAESSQIIVAQRLKRLDRIIEKLMRMPGTNLVRMEDVGGCRAILPGGWSEIEGVTVRIRRNWDVKRERDYIASPKSSGYRGVHVTVERDEHRIEVQLRTPGQQGWANQVELIAGRFRLPLKDEKGPEEILEWLRLAAQGIAHDELGESLDADFRSRFTQAQGAARQWMEEHRP